QARVETPERARELGQLGFMQWLASLPGNGDFRREVLRAYARARLFRDTDPAVAVFCELLMEALEDPLSPLDLALPRPKRRGGARARRLIS
ncbi:MAG: hypothetical protein AAF675_19625, partial [Pseudomonadota bacterium]